MQQLTKQIKLIMKQTSKKIFGTLATVAILSGITGAFSFAALNRWISNEKQSADSELAIKEEEENLPQLMRLSNRIAVP